MASDDVEHVIDRSVAAIGAGERTTRATPDPDHAAGTHRLLARTPNPTT